MPGCLILHRCQKFSLLWKINMAKSRSFWALTAIVLVTPILAADDWPQWLGPKRDGVWREAGIVAKFPPVGPKVLWKQPVGGGFAGPAVSNGRVFVMDRVGAKVVKGK